MLDRYEFLEPDDLVPTELTEDQQNCLDDLFNDYMEYLNERE